MQCNALAVAREFSRRANIPPVYSFHIPFSITQPFHSLSERQRFIRRGRNGIHLAYGMVVGYTTIISYTDANARIFPSGIYKQWQEHIVWPSASM
jgi:hypothetical protein